MRSSDPELKKELDATLQTRKELGPEYEDELVESFLEKVDQRLEARLDKQVRRQVAEQQMVVASKGPRRSVSESLDGIGAAFALAAISLVLAIPLSGLAAANAGTTGLVIAWIGIVGVNAVHSAHRFHFARRDQAKGDTDWRE
ncbi:hypothetical protein QNO07_20565 [Streptomyces sp. 549]|uniref:hypothetical protein n=1 Tax=Streptomyces sp. 549 TaxID=3049076 RepID=UPI0024C21FF2|nr:hypothetical protein [Streptomyces sp. 549]MDK1475782.1 hypothetical protein [Streptomyces sp. 549]